MSNDLPIWLLDVDGVINAVRHPEARFPEPPWSDYQTGSAEAAGNVWPIIWSPSVTKFIGALHNEGFVEVQWLTTWEDDANGSLRELLGLPEFKVAGRWSTQPVDRYANDFTWWKLRCARSIIGTGRPVIWTDDDIDSYVEALDYLDTVDNVHAVVPFGSVGLTPNHIGDISVFISDHF